MPLNRRQRQLYTFRVDLWRPLPLTVQGGDFTGLAVDFGYVPEPAYRGVACYQIESQETNKPSIVGRNNYDIMMTIDQFKFVIEQEIEDGWLIRVRSTGSESATDVGQFYIVQGGAQDKPAIGRREPNQRKVFAVKCPPPQGITL